MKKMKAKGLIGTVAAGIATLVVYQYYVKPFMDKHMNSNTTSGDA